MIESEIERGSLADAFKGTGAQRTSGLGDILGSAPLRPVGAPRSAVKPSAPTAPERAPVTASGAATPQKKVAAAPVAPTPAEATVGDPNKVENVAAKVEADVLAAVKSVKQKNASSGQPDLTYDEMLLDAIDELGIERIREAFAPTPAEDGGLVVRRQRRARGIGGVQIQLRLSKAQQAQLEALIAEVGAPSRSAFVTTVYRLAYVKKQ